MKTASSPPVFPPLVLPPCCLVCACVQRCVWHCVFVTVSLCVCASGHASHVGGPLHGPRPSHARRAATQLARCGGPCDGSYRSAPSACASSRGALSECCCDLTASGGPRRSAPAVTWQWACAHARLLKGVPALLSDCVCAYVSGMCLAWLCRWVRACVSPGVATSAG
jgi:hypothetical protein